MENEMITIPKEEYDNLKDDAQFLSTLFKSGVDKWDGYKDAVMSLLPKN